MLTASGPRSVRWIGRRRLDLARQPRPEMVQPVRIGAHAFAPGLPSRDLCLSPRHCIAWAGALIPAELLIDGASVTRAEW